jgi:hypothetical protein
MAVFKRLKRVHDIMILMKSNIKYRWCMIWMMILKFYRILKSINKSIINILILIIQISTSHILPIILYHLLYFIIMFQINIDNSSINAFASSYHKLCKISKGFLTEKINLPPLNSYLFLTAKLNIKPLIQHIILREN